MRPMWTNLARTLRSHRDAIALVVGLTLPIVVAVALVPFRATFAATAAALVLVAVVVGVAANGSRLAGYVAAASSALWFDFFLTQPYERSAITHRPDIETAVSLFAIGLAVTELAVRSRRYHMNSVEQADFVALVYYLSELVSSGAPKDAIIDRASADLVEVLHLRDCRYEEGPIPRSSTELAHDGTVDLGRIRWGVHSMGLPGKELRLRVQNRGHVLGAFVLIPTSGWPISSQRRLVAVAIADQVGAALVPHLRSVS
jgi:hypothetical protein